MKVNPRKTHINRSARKSLSCSEQPSANCVNENGKNEDDNDRDNFILNLDTDFLVLFKIYKTYEAIKCITTPYHTKKWVPCITKIDNNLVTALFFILVQHSANRLSL